MATHSDSDTELLTEHFGYPPVSLLDDIINSINILAERALNSIEQGLLNTRPATLGFRSTKPAIDKTSHGAAAQASSSSPEEAHRHEIENGTHQLETLLCASIDRNFDKFELYVMRNILRVPPEDRDWIRLRHYQGLALSDRALRDLAEPTTTPSSTTDDALDTAHDTDIVARLVRGVNTLGAKLQASQKLNVMLHAEKARNAVLLRELRALVGRAAARGESESGGGGGGDDDLVKMEEADVAGAHRAPLAFLYEAGRLGAGGAETPLTTTTAFTLSQLQALRALSTSLRRIMPDVLEGTGGDVDHERNSDHDQDEETRAGADAVPKSWRRQRLEYVEAATRKHLENMRGLELAKNGEVRDGEWQGEGPSLAKGEAEGLEAVAAMLGARLREPCHPEDMDES